MTATSPPPQDSDQLEQAELRQCRAFAELVITAETLPTQAAPTHPEENPMSDEVKCPHCGKRLRSNNARGVCKRCFDKGLRGDGVAVVPGAPRAPRALGARKQFKAVTAALGIDGEALLDGFRASWLARIKATVEKGKPDQDDDFELPART